MVSYFEWLQNRSAQRWNLDDVDFKLRETLWKACDAVVDLRAELDVTSRRTLLTRWPSGVYRWSTDSGVSSPDRTLLIGSGPFVDALAEGLDTTATCGGMEPGRGPSSATGIDNLARP
ncbi:MAG: hypothetical protein CM1200mP26_06840 [Acidimicrobiales bacterium]|nr:MAG: hypothetical protein CM1200mP26_06840 [Acidimicrobiales bacterium]